MLQTFCKNLAFGGTWIDMHAQMQNMQAVFSTPVSTIYAFRITALPALKNPRRSF